MRRIGLVLAAGLTLATAGCGRFFGPEPTPTPEPVTLRYVTLTVSPVEEHLIDEFTATHPSITVETELYSNLPASYLLSGNPPDLMFITPGWFLDSAADTDQLVDLTDLWEQVGLNETFPASIRALSERDGRQVFLPVGYGWTGLYYNRVLFNDLGIEPPSTWDELMLAAETLLANGITPFALPGEDTLYTALWFDYLNRRLNGADVHRALMAGEIPFSDARIADLFTTWEWLFQQGYFNRDAPTTDLFTAIVAVAQEPGNSVLTTHAGMVLADPNALQELPDELRARLGVFPFPTIDPTLPTGEVVTATGYMVPAGAPHLDETLAYLNFAAGPDTLRALSENQIDTIPAAGLGSMDSVPAEVQQMAETVSRAAEIAPPFLFQLEFQEQAQVGEIFRTFIRRAVNGDLINIDEILTELDGL